MDFETATAQLNQVKHFYLRGLSEPRDNSLRIVVEEAVANRWGTVSAHQDMDPSLSALLGDAVPIESIEGCRKFEIYWKRYAAYLVTEEGVGSCGKYDDEVYSGTVFRIYDKSHFIDHLARDTGGHLEPLRHFKIICLNHLIDVAAYNPPEIELLLDSPPPERLQ